MSHGGASVQRPRYRHRARMLAFTTTVALSAACVSARPAIVSQTHDPSGVVGCYTVDLGSWEPPMLGADAAFAGPPSRIRMATDTVPQPTWATVTWRSLEPAPGVQPTEYHYAHWNFLDTGEVFLTWSDGFSGVSMVLVAQGNDLVGKAEAFWDRPRPKQSATVRLTRVSCEKPSA